MNTIISANDFVLKLIVNTDLEKIKELNRENFQDFINSVTKEELKKGQHDLKSSQYNFHVSNGEEHLIYNTLYNSFIRLEGDEYNDFVLCNTESSLSENLTENGLWISSDIDEFEKIFADYKINCQYKLFVMDRCFETWLLGNRAAYPKDCESDNFYQYAQFYNVSTSDPEKMNAPESITNISMYHLKYLQEMLHSSSLHVNYSKKSPLAVSTEEYYKELKIRVEITEDLHSLASFFDFLSSIFL